MFVSVIIPTYNRERTIERAIDSVLAQTWKHIEIIVVDDGSSDNTLEVLEKYGKNIKVIAQKNGGPSAARNTGIKAAKGEVISFLDSDDAWLPEKTERQVKLFQRTSSSGVGCCISNTSMVYTNAPATSSFRLADLRPVYPEGVWYNPTEILLTRFLLFNQAAAVKREFLEKTGYFREDLRILEDYDLALRLSLTGPWGYTSDTLVIWNGGSDNSLTSNSTELAACKRSYEILSALNDSSWRNNLPQNLLRKRLNYLRQYARVTELAGSESLLPRWYGRCMGCALRTYKSFSDRMPWFPTMITQGI